MSLVLSKHSVNGSFVLFKEGSHFLHDSGITQFRIYLQEIIINIYKYLAIILFV